MKITKAKELKVWSKYSSCKPRECFTIEHKGKSVEYLPVNNDLSRFRSSIRSNILRTLKDKRYNEIWA